MKRMMTFVFSVAAIFAVQAADGHFRVDLDGRQDRVTLTSEGGGEMNAVPQGWIKDPEAQKCTLMVWSRRKTSSTEWKICSFRFIPSKSGTVVLSVGAGEETAGENRRIQLLVDQIMLNGRLLPNGNFQQTYRTDDGRTVPTGFAAGGEAVLLPSAGLNGPAMLVSHDSRLGFRIKVEADRSCELAFRVKTAPEQPSRPTSDTSLQEQLDRAVKDGKKTIELSAATYRLNETLRLRKLKDFTIDGRGAKLLMTSYVAAMHIEQCEELTIRNLTVDYDPLPHTQGTVLGVDVENKLTRLRLHPGYPRPTNLTPIQAYPFSADRRQYKEGVNEHYGSRLIPREDPAEYDLWTHEPPVDFSAGDLVALRFGRYPCFWIRLTRNLTFETVTVNAAASLVFVARSCTGLQRYKDVRILPGGTLPPGATEPRLLSAGADGINYENSPARIELENCEFSFLGDDSMNIHGTALPLYRQISEHVIRILAPEDYSRLLKPGMTLRLLEPGNFTILAETPIASIKHLAEKAPEETKALFPRTMSIPPCRDIYEIALENPLPEVPAEAIIDFKEINGLSFSVKNCHFHDHRAYGLRMMCSNGLIENNRFERLKGSAIVFGGEYAYWREAGFVDNLVIRNNVIDRVANYPDAASFAAISSIGRPEKRDIGVSRNGSRNIVIERNTISNCPYGGIQLFGVKNITVKDNILTDIGTVSPAWPRAVTLGFETMQPISIGSSVEACTIEENQICETK